MELGPEYVSLLERCPHTHLRTTTMGLSLPVMTIKPFQIINADETIMPKFRAW